MGLGVSAAERGIVVPFVLRRPATQHLTARDRIEACRWDEAARLFGYDRLVIHERLSSDPPEVGNFLSIYRTGEPWATWGLARRDDEIFAWNCATGADIGVFESVNAALLAILPPPIT